MRVRTVPDPALPIKVWPPRIRTLCYRWDGSFVEVHRRQIGWLVPTCPRWQRFSASLSMPLSKFSPGISLASSSRIRPVWLGSPAYIVYDPIDTELQKPCLSRHRRPTPYLLEPPHSDRVTSGSMECNQWNTLRI